MVSAISGVLGLVLVFTPLAPLGAGLLFVSGVTGAGAAGLRIKDRIDHETFELNAETMLDVVDIVTGFIVAGKVATTAFKVVNQASKGSRMAALVQGIETSADVASVVLIGNQFLGELERIENDPSLSPEEKERLKSEILQQAAAAGLLMLVGYAAPKLSRRFGRDRQEKSELDSFKEKSKREKQKVIDEKWKTESSPLNKMMDERRFFEDIMGEYRYKKSDGWVNTNEYSPNFKGVDFYKGTELKNEIGEVIDIYADVAVSMKTTTTKDVKKWLISKPIKKNIGFLEDGLTARGLESNTKTMFITNAEIHIYMPKTNITPELTTTWMSVLKSENPKIKFEIKALENFL